MGASMPGRKEVICSKSVRNVGTSSMVFFPQRKLKNQKEVGYWQNEKADSSAVTGESQKLGERLQTTTAKY